MVFVETLGDRIMTSVVSDTSDFKKPKSSNLQQEKLNENYTSFIPRFQTGFIPRKDRQEITFRPKQKYEERETD